MRLVDGLKRQACLEDAGELRGHALLAQPVLLVRRIIVLLILAFLVVTGASSTAQLGAVDLQHTTPLALEDLLEEPLLDEGRISIALVRLSEVLLLIEHLDESLGELLTRALAVVVLVRAQASITASSVRRMASRSSLLLLRWTAVTASMEQEARCILNEGGLRTRKNERRDCLLLLIFSHFNSAFHSRVDRASIRKPPCVEEAHFEHIRCQFERIRLFIDSVEGNDMHPLLSVVERRGDHAVVIRASLVAIKAPAYYFAFPYLQVRWLKSIAENSNVVGIQICTLILNI